METAGWFMGISPSTCSGQQLIPIVDRAVYGMTIGLTPDSSRVHDAWGDLRDLFHDSEDLLEDEEEEDQASSPGNHLPSSVSTLVNIGHLRASHK